MTDDRVFYCQALLQRSGWIPNAYVTVDEQGLITTISQIKPPLGTSAQDLGGFVIPGFPNGHSHAFQYAMAGLAEHLPIGAASDDFWSWREEMYRLALSVSPEQVQAIAALLYAEMLRFGITSVAEFHYLHHDIDGRPYANPAEMGIRLIEAAATAGIELTLLPVFYQHGGFGRPATPGQKRFLSRSRDEFLLLVEATRNAAIRAKKVNPHHNVIVGTAIHSLRAAGVDDARELLNTPTTLPTHLHIAEQRKEVDDCLEHLGRRPVEWLLENIQLGPQHHLVHATHLTDQECDELSASPATVVICPSTEGNLGDGFFPLARYHKGGGAFALGTDSHISLSPFEDMRWLDYRQRLQAEKRNPLCLHEDQDSGHILFERTWTAGRQALGRGFSDYFVVGQPFDAVVVDPTHPVLVGKPEARRLSALIYASDATCLLGTLRHGRWLVRRQLHEKKTELLAAYSQINW